LKIQKKKIIVFLLPISILVYGAMLSRSAGQTDSSWETAVEAFENGDWNEARESLLKLTDGPQSSPASHLLAITYLNDDNRENAYKAFDKVLGKNDGFFLAAIEKSMAFTLSWELTDVEKILTNAMKANDNSLFAHFLLGIAYEAPSKIEPAKEQYERVIELDPKFAPAYLRLGQTLASVGYFEKALPHVLHYIEFIPDNPAATFRAGRAFFESGRYEEAVGMYRRTLQIKGVGEYNPKISIEMVGALAKLGKYAEALEALEKALVDYPWMLNAHSNAWIMADQLGDYETSKRHALEALDADSRFVWATLQLARLAERENKVEEAIKYYQLVLEHDPNFENARRALKKLSKQPPENRPDK